MSINTGSLLLEALRRQDELKQIAQFVPGVPLVAPVVCRAAAGGRSFHGREGTQRAQGPINAG